MAEVKWIKITTNIFDDEKIKLIDTMPDRDTLLVIWFKLLTLAGKTNDNGFVYIIKEMPTTDEMLATIFNRPLNTVRLALQTFKQFGMIEIDNHVNVVNWEKHQNIEGLDKIKEQNRLRQAKFKEKKKNLLLENKKSNVTITFSNAIDIDLEKDLEKEKDNIPYKEIIDFLNEKAETNYRHTTNKTKELIKARFNENFNLNDFKTVIDKKCFEWLKDKDMSKFLRPETLFGTKFESYLNQNIKNFSEKQQVFNNAVYYEKDEEGNEIKF